MQPPLYAPHATRNPLRFGLPVVRDVCVGPPGRQVVDDLGADVRAHQQRSVV
jgi:hypothetical protein